MLKILRNKKTAKKVWIFLAIIIIPAFALWGFGSAFRSPQEAGPHLKKIFGRQVSYSEYKRSLDAVNIAAAIQFGDNLAGIKKYLNLESQAWLRLVLLQEAKKRKITASDKELVQEIQSLPYFQDKSGFNNKIYNQTLRYALRVQPREFEEQTRQNLILQKLYKQVTEGVSIDEKDLLSEYEKANQQISVYYIRSLAEDFAKDIQPTETQLKEYFVKNEAVFKQPISYNVEYLSFNSVAQAGKASQLLKEGFALEKIARELKLEVKESGFFAQGAPLPGLGWSQESQEIISRLKPGQTSGPIQMNGSAYVLRLKERKEAYIPEFKAVEQKVRKEFIDGQALRMARDKIGECAEYLKSMDFDRAAKKSGLALKSTADFKSGSYIEGIGSSDIFWETAKALAANQASQVITAPAGFYIIKLKSISKLDKDKYGKEKEEFSAKLLSKKRQEKFNQFSEELSKKAQ